MKKKIVLKTRPYGQVVLVKKKDLIDVLERFFDCVDRSDFSSRRFQTLVSKSISLYAQVWE